MHRNTLILLALLLLPPPAGADGIILPEPWVEVAIGRHVVDVAIRDQVAVTEIDQTFLNLSRIREVEGTYVFPLPEGAAISAFSMTVDGVPLAGELLPADEARQIYTDIVRQRIDPALLEYVGRGAYRARIFPIVPGEPKRVQLSYSEVVPERSEVRKYVYPLNTEKFSARALELVSVHVEIESSDPIKNVYCPSHPVEVQRVDDTHVRVIYTDEATTPTTDFVLYYSVSRDDVGTNVMTYRRPDEDGYYMLLAAPRVGVDEAQAARKRVALVLDRSGSMMGEKMIQAQEALRFVLSNLNEQDQFNILDYSTLVSSYAPRMVQVTRETVSAAMAYVGKLQAGGGTNIHASLTSALDQLSDDDYVNMVLFITDGLATVGISDNSEILADVGDRNGAGARIFAFGVGYDVNTHLLDRLGMENHGTSAYVKPGEDIEEEVSAFYSQISHPVLSDLSLDFGQVLVQDFYPRALPDLFKGSQVVQLGRYSGPTEGTVTLSGTANGQDLSFVRAAPFPAEAEENDFLPRLWATRKIGFLLDQIRLNGEDGELVDEIIALSRSHGIITPYTSFLVVEDDPPPRLSFGAGFEKDSGADAVAASEATRNLAGAISAPGTQVAADEGGLKVIGAKTFYLRDGIWKDAVFTDGQPTQDYAFGSDPYFDLLSRFPALGPYLAVGKDVIVHHDGVTYRVGTDFEQSGTLRSDFSGDGRVDFADLARFARAFGSAEEEDGFDPGFDLDGDGRVGFGDYVVLASEFGQTR